MFLQTVTQTIENRKYVFVGCMFDDNKYSIQKNFKEIVIDNVKIFSQSYFVFLHFHKKRKISQDLKHF